MTARRLDGKLVAQTLRAAQKEAIDARAAAGLVPPGLAVVLVGDHPASASYVRHKQVAAREVGITSQLIHYPATVTERELLDTIADLNADAAVHGILVQLPLPAHVSVDRVVEAIGPVKDVDCFHPENVGSVVIGRPRFAPCTPMGVVELLRAYDLETAGRHAVVVGRSNIVGKPLAAMMMQRRTAANPLGCDSTVTVAHTGTRDLASVCRTADILIAAAGVAGLVTAEMVRPGAVVVDVGTNSVNGKLVGDVDRSVGAVAGWLSPVPGGVGPLTIAMLLANVLHAAATPDGTRP